MARRTGIVLTESDIIASAIKRIDEQGLDSLSIRTMGEELGVTGPALYHYFSTKTDLLRAVARSVMMAEPPFPRMEDDTEWQDWFLAGAMSYREALLKHPNMVPLFVQLHPRGVFPEFFDHAAKILRSSSFPPKLLLTILDAIESLALGSAMNTVYGATKGDDSEPPPNVAYALRHNRVSEDARFELACRALLSGFETLSAPSGPKASRAAKPVRTRPRKVKA
jgi:TetR/AcrR family transcriptional regulator, tetracycline repressor protein